MRERFIPVDIIDGKPTAERKEILYKGEHVSIIYYPDRIGPLKYYFQVLRDKLLYPFNVLRFKYNKRKHLTTR